MRLGIIISSNDSETVWNAMRIGLHSRDLGDEVTFFFIGKGVESEKLDHQDFKINEYVTELSQKGVRLFACGTCLKLRSLATSERIQVGTLAHLYEIIRSCEKLVTF